MSQQVMVPQAPHALIVIPSGVIRAETPMTDDEFNLLNEMFIILRSPMDEQCPPGYLTQTAQDMVNYTSVLCAKYRLPKTGGRYYIAFLASGKYLEWWSHDKLREMGYEPKIAGERYASSS